MKTIDDYRYSVLADIVHSRQAISTHWPTFCREITDFLGPHPTGQQVLDLGDQLRAIFKSVTSDRSQSSLSNAGQIWEFLVMWYLNLCFHGTNAVVVNMKKALIPGAVRDSLAITISNRTANTESDLVVLGFRAVPTTEFTMDDLDAIIRANPLNLDLSVIQCKSNWNDNAQIPMLWDIVYNGAQGKNSHVAVGRGGLFPLAFNSFGYSFATVPTNDPNKIKETSMQVLRVQSLSGGNYWGMDSKTGVAASLKEFFTRSNGVQFSGTTVAQSIETHTTSTGQLQDFLDLKF